MLQFLRWCADLSAWGLKQKNVYKRERERERESERGRERERLSF